MEVRERLQEIFRDVFDDERLELRDDMVAADVEKWDSVGHINLMFAIEEAFGIQFSSDEFMKFSNVGALKDYLARRAS
jgi:acyl carrier protein